MLVKIYNCMEQSCIQNYTSYDKKMGTRLNTKCFFNINKALKLLKFKFTCFSSSTDELVHGLTRHQTKQHL